MEISNRKQPFSRSLIQQKATVPNHNTLAQCIFIALVAMTTASTSAQEPVQFNRDIRPILSDRCFQCHGPDEKKREAGLRLDLESEAKKDLGGYHAIVPGDLDASDLIERILSEDSDVQMPPPDSGKKLSKNDIDLLSRWVEEGAAFEKHWSFQEVVRHDPPTVANPNWVKNRIDRFVLAQLESRKLQPSPEADRNTLIRRLSLDLTGLPPSPREVTEFINDESPDAYEKLVDRLLASKHYGERLGRHWLDLARYADSNGYANDGRRSIWPYRDWVIKALNDDMPFDQFTVEQLAGDLLPNPTESQLIATGFHRNTPLQTEGGSDPEQYRVERTKNRTDTTGAVWLGLTVGCAQCHTHKFDPITHEEYYQLYAFFNSVDEPTYALEAGSTKEQIVSVKAKIATIEQRIAVEKEANAKAIEDQNIKWTTLDLLDFQSEGGATLTQLDDGSILASEKNPSQDVYRFSGKLPQSIQAIRIETLTHPSLPQKGPGRAGNGNFVLAELDIKSQNRTIKIASATADHSQDGHEPTKAFDGDFGSGWAINVKSGSMNVNRTAIFALSEAAKEDLLLKISTYEKGNGYNIGRIRISTSPIIPQNLDSKVARLESELTQEKSILAKLEKQQPKTLIVRQRAKPRDSFIQLRGDFLDPGKPVTPATLDVLPGLVKTDAGEPTRLDLAKWLTSKNHPLTSRVQANRMWQHLFGIGLVKTENDFGYQGALPTHPQLLDYLASELVDGGWRLKPIYKQILMSATYRQSSHFRDDLYAVDAANESLAKQNRYRVEGEIVRDVALAASGLLSTKMGGPSVFPPIPPNVIGTSSARHSWPTSSGEDRYRRGIYTTIYRANVYPMLLAFDGPDRDNACTRRGRSNTPLQALTMANDAAFIEMSQSFGRRIMDQGNSPQLRIESAFASALSRAPTDAELSSIAKFQISRLAFYQNNPQETQAMAQMNSPELASWIAVARVVLNLDEFITRE